MTSIENVGHTAPSDAALNLLWPGLAQLCQRRLGPAVLFSLANACASGLFIWSSPNRVPATVALLAGMIWSIVDARAHAHESKAQPPE